MRTTDASTTSAVPARPQSSPAALALGLDADGAGEVSFEGHGELFNGHKAIQYYHGSMIIGIGSWATHMLAYGI